MTLFVQTVIVGLLGAGVYALMSSGLVLTYGVMRVINLAQGAFVILGAYLALQREWLDSKDRSYSAMNFVGAALLTWVAVADRRVGFILLEGSWALLSIPGMLRRAQPRVASPECRSSRHIR